MPAYYNEFDPYAAQWLRNLIAAGHIAPGDVDERNIREVSPDDVRNYTQCHFFAGIGGWSLALRLAGWGDDRPVWTGSCPCQPFSPAGAQEGHADGRHLWPHWFGLIRKCRPGTVLGEQVAGAVAFGWLDECFNDMEAEAYACAASVLPACSVGAPHKRERLWFVGNAQHNGRNRGQVGGSYGGNVSNSPERENSAFEFAGASKPGDVADTSSAGLANSQQKDLCGAWGRQEGRAVAESSASNWIACPDGKSRPVKPGLRLLADGVPARVGRLRAYGNAIVPQVAAEFIKAFMEVRPNA